MWRQMGGKVHQMAVVRGIALCASCLCFNARSATMPPKGSSGGGGYKCATDNKSFGSYPAAVQHQHAMGHGPIQKGGGGGGGGAGGGGKGGK